MFVDEYGVIVKILSGDGVGAGGPKDLREHVGELGWDTDVDGEGEAFEYVGSSKDEHGKHGEERFFFPGFIGMFSFCFLFGFLFVVRLYEG